MTPDDIIAKFGLTGVIMVGMAYAIIKLWGAYTASQDARIAEARESTKEVADVGRASAAALQAMANRLEARNG